MSLYDLDGVSPEFPESGDCWVAPGAHLIGRIILREGASVWFSSVLRGDNEAIIVGRNSNIQDACVCHTDMGFPLTVGEGCTVGHMTILHGCTLRDGCLVGMNSTVLNGAVIGEQVLVGAGSLVTEGKEFPPRTLVMGRPAKVVRDLTDKEVAGLARTAEGYRRNMDRFRKGLKPIQA